MKYLFFLLILFFNFFSLAQEIEEPMKVKKKDIEFFKSFLPDFEINASDDQYLRKWRRTKYFVKSVYDYAMISSAMLTSFEDTLSTISSKKERKKYLKNANKMLKSEFGYEIKNMSITRGSFLMKLIYRNTGLSAYEIVKKYRGSGSAFWFQSLCLLNGQDLKKTYDPENEDYLIEKAARLIETGDMSFLKRVPMTKAAQKAMQKEKKRKRKKTKREK
tara:strand:+ start:6140 stop:6793 length:654 start_codon:yes stop_codon:yes gene_type:complete